MTTTILLLLLFNVEYYQAKSIKALCKISQRVLDYWIERDIIIPTKCILEGKNTHQDKTYLFTRDDLKRALTVKSMREVGVPLQKIKNAFDRIAAKKLTDPWNESEIYTDGTNVYLKDEFKSARLNLHEVQTGQLCCIVIGLRNISEAVEGKLVSGSKLSQINCINYEAKKSKIMDWNKLPARVV